MLDGFGRSLEVILPKLREGYVTPDSDTARTLALENPHAFFLAPSGECFHNVTVTGGKPRAEGPLALKRELRETQQKLESRRERAEPGRADRRRHSRKTSPSSRRRLDVKSEERRNAERESANHSAALRQMESEVQRLERRLQDWTLQSERNKDARASKADLHRRRSAKRRSRSRHERASEIEVGLNDMQRSVEELRIAREEAQQQAAQVSAAAGRPRRTPPRRAVGLRADRPHVSPISRSA